MSNPKLNKSEIFHILENPEDESAIQLSERFHISLSRIYQIKNGEAYHNWFIEFKKTVCKKFIIRKPPKVYYKNREVSYLEALSLVDTAHKL